jgi:hypothetical protein
MSKKTTATKKTSSKKAAAANTKTTNETAAPAASHNPTTAAVSTAIALGLAVFVTLPPAEKFNDPTAKPYWQIEIKDKAGQRYSNVYRVTDLGRAHNLAEKIATERKIPIITQELPVFTPRAQAEAPAQEQPPTDFSEVPTTPLVQDGLADPTDFGDQIPF